MKKNNIKVHLLKEPVATPFPCRQENKNSINKPLKSKKDPDLDFDAFIKEQDEKLFTKPVLPFEDNDSSYLQIEKCKSPDMDFDSKHSHLSVINDNPECLTYISKPRKITPVPDFPPFCRKNKFLQT